MYTIKEKLPETGLFNQDYATVKDCTACNFTRCTVLSNFDW